MELLLALDFVTLSEAKEILREVGDGIDIVEMGTPFVIQEGIQVIREIKKEFPALKVSADLKIMDAGDHESRMAFEVGADIVTVLGVAHNATIIASVEQAKKFGASIMIDMIGVADIESRTREIDGLGIHYICVHTAFDIQGAGKNSLEELQKVKKIVRHGKTAVAGGITLGTIAAIVRERPDIIIVGGGITGQTDKRQATLAMKTAMGGYPQ